MEENQHFCTQCGKKVIGNDKPSRDVLSKYSAKIEELEEEYDSKQAKAMELVNKLFDPTHMSYGRFSSSITKSNQLFYNQLQIAKRMVEMDNHNLVVEHEIESKIATLQKFIDKMDDLSSELVIQYSSNKEDEEEIHNLFDAMDDLIDSVKDY